MSQQSKSLHWYPGLCEFDSKPFNFSKSACVFESEFWQLWLQLKVNESFSMIYFPYFLSLEMEFLNEWSTIKSRLGQHTLAKGLGARVIVWPVKYNKQLHMEKCEHIISNVTTSFNQDKLFYFSLESMSLWSVNNIVKRSWGQEPASLLHSKSVLCCFKSTK